VQLGGQLRDRPVDLRRWRLRDAVIEEINIAARPGAAPYGNPQLHAPIFAAN
jgi:hypothetical protein